MKSKWLLSLAFAFVQCAMNPSSGPLYINGKRMGNWEAKGQVLGVTVYDYDGNQIYYSDFIGGCKNIPQAGNEVLGTRFRYDKNGNFMSKWEISDDSSHAV